jgi:hypothetical protein
MNMVERKLKSLTTDWCLQRRIRHLNTGDSVMKTTETLILRPETPSKVFVPPILTFCQAVQAFVVGTKTGRRFFASCSESVVLTKDGESSVSNLQRLFSGGPINSLVLPQVNTVTSTLSHLLLLSSKSLNLPFQPLDLEAILGFDFWGRISRSILLPKEFVLPFYSICELITLGFSKPYPKEVPQRSSFML